MPQALAPEDQTETTRQLHDWREGYEGTAALRLAARALASGAVTSKKQAAHLAGVTPEYFSQLTANVSPSEPLMKLMAEVEQKIADKSVDLSSIIRLLSREAIDKAVQIMRGSKSEALQLKAAHDFMDRNPELSKTQKHIVTSFSLDGQDAKELAAVLVETAAMREAFTEVEEGDYVTVDISENVDPESPDGR